MSIAIIDYGAGNLRSVQKALEKLGLSAVISDDKTVIESSKAIILPGVGAFDSAISELMVKELDQLIISQITSGKPFLGLCLGMQLLLDCSEEGTEKGFGTIKGKVNKFVSKELKIPHMGWNNIKIQKASPIMKGIPDGSMVYFVHSYYCAPDESSTVLTTTDYGTEFTSSVSRDNLFGLQFHPEKSGDIGLQILKNFGELSK